MSINSFEKVERWILSRLVVKTQKQNQVIFSFYTFFLEYIGELHIISSKNRKKSTKLKNKQKDRKTMNLPANKMT